MKVWDIWVEGYAATGEHGPAYLMGQESAETFDDAVEKLMKHYPEADKYYQHHEDGRHTYWACRLFDNEQDARKNFG